MRTSTQPLIQTTIQLTLTSILPSKTPNRAETPQASISTYRTTKATEPTPVPTNLPERINAQVERVIDGDTIQVIIEGKAYTVRYIGIDTPETVAPNQPIEWLGPEATKVNKDLVEGKIVSLEKDVSETDKYGRLLRHVFVGDILISAELVSRGYAQVSTYPPDVKYQSRLLELQREARDAGNGLWSQVSATSEPPALRFSGEGAEHCDPSYPDVCISPSPPDLNCKDISYKDFKVLPPDPHRFDGDHDGLGCETRP